VANVLDKAPAPMTSLSAAHPKALESVVDRLLAKRASDRNPTASDVAGALLGIKGPHGRLGEWWRSLISGA
jgi:hypothetical protein